VDIGKKYNLINSNKASLAKEQEPAKSGCNKLIECPDRLSNTSS
jgi:hypothetical protein